ncbi:hypothetical protein AB4Y37_25110 [Paraburkholderia caribensis]|nr:hypothetical protein [Paraburkholderia caribensis]MDR6380212.1 hypothetical protein [Paraburkholderia caribensis]
MVKLSRTTFSFSFFARGFFSGAAADAGAVFAVLTALASLGAFAGVAFAAELALLAGLTAFSVFALFAAFTVPAVFVVFVAFGLAPAASGATTGACSTVAAFFASEVRDAFTAGFLVSAAGSFALFGKW